MEIKAKNVWFRARAKATGKLVEGYFVMTHTPVFAADNITVEKVISKPCIYNDLRKGENSTYWTEIDISTLELIEQLTLFDD